MKLKDLFVPLVRWWWLIILSTGLAAGVSYMTTKPLKDVFSARSSLIIGSALSDPNPSGTEFTLTRQLAEAYATIAERAPIQEATIKALGLNRLPSYSAAAVPNSPFIEITVTDTDPELAQAVANEIATQVVLQSPTNPQQQDQERLAFVNQQLANMQEEIIETQDQISAKQQELANLNSAFEIEELQSLISALETKRTLLQTNYATLFATTQSGALNRVDVFERASRPTRPIGPNKILIILLASAAGFAFSAGAAYLLEFLDRSLKTPEDIAQVLKTTVIGQIAEMEKSNNHPAYMVENPRSPIAEAFRTLRTNLEFAGVDKPIKSLLVTSVDVGDGKTTVATNMALALAQTEKTVMLMDADLRRPNVHTALELPSEPGLSQIFKDRLNIPDVSHCWKDQKVTIVTSGGTPPNPAELLSSKRMGQLLNEIDGQFDMLILDGPPMLVTDALILASKVDGVILVVRPGVTREDNAKAAMENLNRAGTRVVGVVMNRMARRKTRSYTYYAGNYN